MKNNENKVPTYVKVIAGVLAAIMVGSAVIAGLSFLF